MLDNRMPTGRRLSRIGRFLANIAIWPFRTLSRLTPDGALFLALVLLCSLTSVERVASGPTFRCSSAS